VWCNTLGRTPACLTEIVCQSMIGSRRDSFYNLETVHVSELQ